MAPRADAGPDALEIVVVTARLDFRDALALALACTDLKRVVAHGPLHLVTDSERLITRSDVASLHAMLRWCGGGVMTLRVEQQARHAYSAGLPRAWDYEAGVYRHHADKAAVDAVLSTMPSKPSAVLAPIWECCPKLEELVMRRVHCQAWHGPDADHLSSALAGLARLPKLCRVHISSEAFFGPDADAISAGLLRMLDARNTQVALAARRALTRLSICVGPNVAKPLLQSAHAARMLQLWLGALPPETVALLRGCTSLRRLALHGCVLSWGGSTFTPSDILPSGLRSLRLIECYGTQEDGAAAALAAACPRLEQLELGFSCRFSDEPDDAPFETDDATDPQVQWRRELTLPHRCLTDLASLHSLVVLDMPNAMEFDDGELMGLARGCPLLHTLILAGSGVTAVGFDFLRYYEASDPDDCLPRLRVLSYTNDKFECGLMRILRYCPSAEEEKLGPEVVLQHRLDALARDMEEEWDDIEAEIHDYCEELRDKALRDWENFYAFAGLVVGRDLQVPEDNYDLTQVPLEHQHPLVAEVFA